jgi:AGZA family xanthine/uracil permease-like MFS transporter
MLERLFQLKAHNTNVRTEILAGVTTFLAMAYILFVNPSILGETGMDKGAVFVATCPAAAIGSTVMGLIANYPIALAPGMGLNAFFTYTVVLHMGHTWQVALGAVFISAVCSSCCRSSASVNGSSTASRCRCARRLPPVSACSWR